ncbi:hypothetical protein [Falsibacillus albus]|uniref:DUF2651 domain-containing protein n=1 Tax=Falsibacillus albus TaxID=2478915 RepID=A0A3L7JNG8_9BACI|nr:hypothetical protein [Falsibacillus albus]RLQ92367.1 hypothetical protein D9X91_19140 [Falsibacillus albus]
MEVIYYLLYWHFLLMVVLILILSALVSVLFPRIHFLFLILASGLAAYFYTVVVEVKDLTLFTIIVNSTFSFIGIGYVKCLIYLKKKGEEYQDSNI